MGRRLALLVATYEYEDSGLRRLTTPAQDAEALAAVLADPEIAGFEVRTLVNEPAQSVGRAIAQFYGESERDDLTLLYFSGHGLKDDSGRLYLAMTDTERTNLRFTGLSANLVDEVLAESRSGRQILILDCCYSGAYVTQQFAKADAAVHTLETLGGRGRTVLTASDSTQYAFEGGVIHGEAAQSVFTRHLVSGLRDGAADLDHDGDITVDELYNYVYERVLAEQPNQHPKRLDQVEGRTVIAANINWTLPGHVENALSSSLPAIRATAIDGLGRLLWANNQLVRRTARERLERLAEDESDEVATAARAVLDAPGQQFPAAPKPQPLTVAGSRDPATAPVARAQPADVPPVDWRTARRQAAQDLRRAGSAASDLGPTFGAAARASAQRWRNRIRRIMRPPGADRRVFIPSVIGAAAAIWALVEGYLEHRVTYHLLAVAVVLMAAFVIQLRIKASATAFTAGLGATSLLAIPVLIGRLTGWVMAGDNLSDYRLLSTAIILSHAAWLIAGIAAIALLIRADDATVRRPMTARAATLIGLGALSALTIIAILLLLVRQSGDRLNYFTVLAVLAAELAIAGPLIALRLRESRAFLGGWVLGGTVVWLGLFHGRRAFREPETPEIVVSALLVLWLVLGVVGLLRAEGREDVAARSPRWWVIAALLVAPVVLAGVPVSVVPKAKVDPLAFGMVVSPGNDVLYVADFANDRILRLNTTTQEEIGGALSVGDQPTQLVLNPEGSRLYVASAGANTVTAIDVAAWKVAGTPVAVSPGPVGLALHAATHRLLVLSRKSASINVINTVTMTTVGGPMGTGADPSDVEFTEDGSRMLIARSSDKTVAVIDPATRKPVRTPIALSSGPTDLLRGPDNLVYAVTGSEYAVIDLRKTAAPERFPLPGPGRLGALSADGERLFVLGAIGDKESLIMMDVRTRTVAGSSDLGDSSTVNLTTSSDGQRAYVSRLLDSTILVFDTIGPKQVGTINLDG